jgi:gamma-glutamyl hercynylcysteine S-oxide synthase
VVQTITARSPGRSTVGNAEPTKAELVSELEALLSDVRERTLLLLSPLNAADLREQHDSLMSPVIWDLGHIAAFEELWLVRLAEHMATKAAPFGEMPGLFNPFEHPRRERGALPLPSIDEVRAKLAEIRRQVLDRLPVVCDNADSSPLTRDGYVYRMVAQHEAQHDETILQTLQLKRGDHYHPPLRSRESGLATSATSVNTVDNGPLTYGQMVWFPGGEIEIGTNDRRAAYDNERPLHSVRVDPFLIDVAPVTNGAYLTFMAAGGYSDQTWWSPAGRAWLSETRAESPQFWHRPPGGGGGSGDWWSRSMDRSAPVAPDHPVIHVSFYEAEAFAAWAGKRLPTEIEWEAAATWDPGAGRSREFPWGDEPVTADLANVDQLSFGTTPLGAYPRNVSPIGCYGMIGDVWEWTSSDFGPYPGFETFPYREYSEVFFGSPDYKVLRGGSWATRSIVARSTFRNWDYPQRRQIFSGFRCARDA